MTPKTDDYNRFDDDHCDHHHHEADVVDKDEQDDLEALGDWAMYSNHNLASLLAWFSAIVFVGSTIAYVDECTQAYGAQDQPGTTFWSPYLAVFVSLLGLFCQARLASIPFKKCIQGPIIQEYTRRGIQIRAHTLKRQRQESKSHKLVLVYRPTTTTIYAKEFDIGDELFFEIEFPILILPGIPTSAILKQRYQEISDPERDNRVYRYGIVAPMLWGLATGSGFVMASQTAAAATTDDLDFDESSWWAIQRQWGLLWLFGISVVSSLLWGYIMTVSEAKEWLLGDSMPIDEYKAENKWCCGAIKNNCGDGCQSYYHCMEIV